MHLWRKAILLASAAGFAFALGTSGCDDKSDDTNGESDADTDADADTDTDADSDTDPACTPEDICALAGPKGQDCQFTFVPLNGDPKQCADWYKTGAKNCPKPGGGPDGNMNELVDCQCFCRPGPPGVTKGDDPCVCLQGCMVDYCPPP
jgi:hypothetical protein